MEKAAVFVDLDSLNVLYKVGSKFAAALNYASGLDRLGETLPALGAGFDVYLCLKPRAPSEGDLVIDELSITGLPFTVDSAELYQVLKFFRGYSGFGEVYLCNWVHNFIQIARVKTFHSVVYYGNRVALMQVKDGVLQGFKLYANQREFELEEPDFDGYGDVGLVDVDGFRAQYPEFAEGTKPQITTVAPLAQCYRTSLKMETGELLEKLTDARNSGVPLTNTFKEPECKEAESPDDPNLKPVNRPKPTPDVAEDDWIGQDDLGTPRGETPSLAILFTVLAAIISLAFGGFAGVVAKYAGVIDNSSYYSQVEQRVAGIQGMTGVYTNAPVFTTEVKDAWKYCNSSGMSVTVSGLECAQDQFVVRYSCVSESDSQPYADYIGKQYAVADVNSLGAAEVLGETVYQYSVTFGLDQEGA